MSRYQKGKTNQDFTGARDSEWQWHQLGHMQVCTSLQADNHTSTPQLSFLQARCLSCRPSNSVKALKAISTHNDPFVINSDCECTTHTIYLANSEKSRSCRRRIVRHVQRVVNTGGRSVSYAETCGDRRAEAEKAEKNGSLQSVRQGTF